MNKKPNSVSSAGTKDDSSKKAEVTSVCQHRNKPIVSGSAFAVYPDSIRYGVSNKNELMAVFRLEEQARIFGARMWGQFYTIKQIVSEHFS